ncbi:FAD-dependent oxidoreductase [Planosporangium mesophilum]|uniref:FAD-dependent oxidoreductase n=2 Tax=Planosporangium mesophilum TaxID=689768 RepID=A0A8J3X707_9ACTN|nr:FAD-dependent oxidoreductase [Planosporangium mesophilum]
MGGGIAGPVTAMALQRAGIDSVVYEAYGHGSDGVGAFLTLAENGLAALDVLDLAGAVGTLGIDTPAMKLVSRGRELARMPMRGRTVGRSELYQTLRDEAVRRGIAVEYGKRLDTAEFTATGVRARFTDGAVAEADLLVGADGLRSRTRTVIDPHAPRPRHIGLLNTGGYARGIDLPGEPGVAHFVFGRRCFFGYFIVPGGEVWWFANPPSRHEPSRAELLAVTPDEWRARLVDLFRDDTGPMLDLIAATDHIFPGWNTYDFPRVPTWHNDRMVLVGDAVHATSPSSGQGASLAIEDGVMLARCLRDLPAPAAFDTFKRLRQQRVERVVAQGKRSGDGKAQGRVGAAIRDLVLPVVARRMVATSALDWMYDYRIDWEAPVGTVR